MGYFLRVTNDRDEASAMRQVERAWRHLERGYMSDGPCVRATVEVFVDRGRINVGTGLFFNQRPRWWDAIVEDKPEWILLDNLDRMVADPVCFFTAQDRCLPDWSCSAD